MTSNNQAKQILEELRSREPKGDKRETLNMILKHGAEVERKEGRAYWANYLKNYNNHLYDRT